MFRLFLERLVWASSFTVLLAFFLPWLTVQHLRGHARELPGAAVKDLYVEAQQPWYQTYLLIRDREISEALTDPLEGTSGLKLLLSARSEAPEERTHAQRLVSYLGTGDPGKASLLVYLVPASALAAACFITVCRRSRVLLFVPLIACGFIYGMMRYRLNESYFERLVQNLSAGLGLWLSLYGLLLIVVLLGLQITLTFGKK